MYKYLTIVLLLVVSGCSAAQQTVQNEKSLQVAVWPIIQERCGQFGKIPAMGQEPTPNTRKDAVKMSMCASKIIKEEVVPKSAFPDLYLMARAAQDRAAKQYSDGKIDEVEWKARSAEIQAQSIRELQNRLEHIQQNQSAAQQRSFQNWATMQELQNQQMQNNRSIQTNCSHMGTFTNCTTY